MSRPFKGEAYYADRHIGCRVLKHPVASEISRIAEEESRPFGSVCNAIIKQGIAKLDKTYSLMPRSAAIMLEKASADNPKKDFTLYLTTEEHAVLSQTAELLEISQNRLVTALLCDYLIDCGREI